MGKLINLFKLGALCTRNKSTQMVRLKVKKLKSNQNRHTFTGGIVLVSFFPQDMFQVSG